MAIFGLVSRRELREALKDKQKRAEILTATAEGERYNIPDISIYGNQADLYRRLSWILAAVSIAANDAASVPGGVKKIKGEDTEEIKNHPFEKLLMKPNPMDSRHELFYATVAAHKINGNAYWWLNKANEKAEVDEIWAIPPHMISPVPDEKLYLKGYLYYPANGAQIPLEPWEVCHFKTYNPFSRFVGLSPIESLGVQATGDLKMQEWNTRLFAENNARLPGILAFKQFIANDEWERLKKESRDSAAKRDLLMLRGVGDGVSWMQAAASQKDMEFLSGRTFTKEELWAVLAPGLSSMLSINSTEANAIAGAATFNGKTIYPLLRMMGEKITNIILPAYGEELVFEFEDVRWQDKAQELQEIIEYSKTHTVEEVRRLYYNDQPLGDERDKMIASQVTAKEPQEVPEELQVVPENVQEKPPEPEEVAEEEENDELKETLAKFRRKAMKKIGKDVTFVDDLIPPATLEILHNGLPACKSEEDIRALFDGVQETPVVKPDWTELKNLVAQEIEAIKASKQQQPVNVTVHNHPGEPPIVNIPETKSEQPIINVSVNPTPVTVENTVNVPEQPPTTVNVAAPVVNVTTPKREKRTITAEVKRAGGLVDKIVAKEE